MQSVRGVAPNKRSNLTISQRRDQYKFRYTHSTAHFHPLRLRYGSRNTRTRSCGELKARIPSGIASCSCQALLKTAISSSSGAFDLTRPAARRLRKSASSPSHICGEMNSPNPHFSRSAIPAFRPERAVDISRWFHHRKPSADASHPGRGAGRNSEQRNFFLRTSVPRPGRGAKAIMTGFPVVPPPANLPPRLRRKREKMWVMISLANCPTHAIY